MTEWNPNEYLRFGDERMRPSADLASRIEVERPRSVVDLGCGPGNSTSVLKRRWPDAHVVGLDSSAEMIAAARTNDPAGEWLEGDIASWEPGRQFDIVFSNAALQWLPDHGPLISRLFGRVANDGALAFQIPSATYARVRTLIHEIALEEPWSERMEGPLNALTMESPEFYYDNLAASARAIELWETEYLHVMESFSAIVDWISSTGLRPYLAALDSDAERGEFVARLRERTSRTYETRSDGRVLFPFRRTFVIAYR